MLKSRTAPPSRRRGELVVHACGVAGDLGDALVAEGDQLAPVARGHGVGHVLRPQALGPPQSVEGPLGEIVLCDTLVGCSRGHDGAGLRLENDDLDGSGTGVHSS
ncbi:MAG: hypothetical protein ACYST0_02250, partial [Planctomycetota bacterium]